METICASGPCARSRSWRAAPGKGWSRRWLATRATRPATRASLACNARNAARNAAAAALGGAATDRYQNQLLRELAGGQELRFGFARREIRMTSELVRIGAAARALSVAARLTPSQPTP